MLVDTVLVYAILGAFAALWIFDFWVAGRSDDE